MRAILSFVISVLIVFILQSCNNDEVKNEKQDKNNQTEIKKESSLLNIPQKIKGETDRYEINTKLIGITVFEAGITPGETEKLMAELFPGCETSFAEASETFDAFNIVYEDKDYCCIFTYEMNDAQEVVIHTVFAAEGKFRPEILEEIFS